MTGERIEIDPDLDWPYGDGRRPGCESKNHGDACYGALWRCDGCGKQFCYAEGADDQHFELCDSCVAKAG